MSYLVNYLLTALENLDNRVIIFSQWNKMLVMVSIVLKEANIKYVFCRGNVHIITKSIYQFKKDSSIRIILLSSENCSSGNNLTEASHIVLLDTINTNKDTALAIENQAIGRAVRLGQNKQVQVLRLIMKNTVEEEYYHRNYNALSNHTIEMQ